MSIPSQSIQGSESLPVPKEKSQAETAQSHCLPIPKALTIIVMIGSLSALALGCAALGNIQGWWHAENLALFSQVHAIILISAGSSFFLLTLAILVVGRDKTVSIETKTNEKIVVTEAKDEEPSVALSFGVQAYREVGIEILNAVEDPPAIPWDEKDPYFNEAYRNNFIQLYLPEKVRFNGKEREFNGESFAEFLGQENFQIQEVLRKVCGQTPASGWILISLRGIPQGSVKTTIEQDPIVDDLIEFRSPLALEAAVAKYMMKRYTNREIYSQFSPARCEEKFHNGYIVVGSILSDKMEIFLWTMNSDAPALVVVKDN